jgi:hypothetical protein
VNFVNLRAQALWNALFVASICAILGAVIFLFVAPPLPQEVRRLPTPQSDLEKATAMSANAKGRIESKLWDLDSQELGASVLSNLNGLAEKQHIQVADFRIEKPFDVAGQREAPFVVVLEGDFKAVMKVVASLEDPKSKLGISMLQMATSDKGTGAVKATVGLTAFLRSEA